MNLFHREKERDGKTETGKGERRREGGKEGKRERRRKREGGREERRERKKGKERAPLPLLIMPEPGFGHGGEPGIKWRSLI